MSIGIRWEMDEVEKLSDRIQRFGRANTRDLMDSIAFEGENQTRRRIAEEKAAPDGTPWPNWSSNYAATRRGGHSLLESDGSLVDTLVSNSDDDYAEWGSNLVYFAIQNFGGTPDMAPGPAGIPARTMLGLSDENQQDIEGIVNDWAERQAEDL